MKVILTSVELNAALHNYIVSEFPVFAELDAEVVIRADGDGFIAEVDLQKPEKTKAAPKPKKATKPAPAKEAKPETAQEQTEDTNPDPVDTKGNAQTGEDASPQPDPKPQTPKASGLFAKKTKETPTAENDDSAPAPAKANPIFGNRK